MASPAEVVHDAFADAKNYAADATKMLLSFTTRLNDAIQTTPLLDVSFLPVADPGTYSVPEYTPPSAYTSSTFTLVRTTVEERLAGGTGLAPAVEAALWDRGRERELSAAQAAIDQATSDAEAMGFVLPPGVLMVAIEQANRDYWNKASTLSRDIALKQADLEQSNRDKSIDQALQLENVLADVDAKRSQVALDGFRAQILVFQAMVEQDTKHWEVSIKQYEAQQNYTLTAQKLNGEIVRANSSALLEAAKTGTQAFAQLVASAYSMIHASASVSGSSSMSVGYSYSNDTADAPASVTAI